MAVPDLAEHKDVLEQYKALRQNDEATLQRLYTANYHKVEQYVLHNNGSAEQAKDIFQEAFIAVWRNIQLNKYQPQNGTTVEAYLFQIAKNKWMDHLRSGHYKKVVRMEKAPEPGLNTVYTPVEENEYLEAVKRYFQQLGENCKKILSLFYYHNESLKDIADQMGWTEATARNNKYRCIQKLRELINK